MNSGTLYSPTAKDALATLCHAPSWRSSRSAVYTPSRAVRTTVKVSTVVPKSPSRARRVQTLSPGQFWQSHRTTQRAETHRAAVYADEE